MKNNIKETLHLIRTALLDNRPVQAYRHLERLDDYFEKHQWHRCEHSSTGYCVYNDEEDQSHDSCLVCGDPHERK